MKQNKILVVEDDESLCRLALTILRNDGYEVISARNAEEAIILANTHPDLDLLLTDVIMTGKSGSELADLLLQDLPRLKILFMSGYGDRDFSNLGQHPLLAKPFQPQKLLSTIRQLLPITISRAC